MDFEMDDFSYLKANKYYLFYEMMMQALKTDDVVDGINLALFLLKCYLSSGHVVLHKKNENGVYVPNVTDSSMRETTKTVSSLVNNTAPLVENREIFGLDLDLSDDYKSIMFVYIKTNSNDYVLTINNYYVDEIKKEDTKFFEQLRDTVKIILKRAESYEKNKRAIKIDVLTGLDNRNSYEHAVQRLDENKEGLIYGLFDLFRLKYINDNFNHSAGDKYIVEVAKILAKYWPKYKVEIIDNEEKVVETGSCIYRVGGDEFVLITNSEKIELTRLKAHLASEEVKLLDLGVDEELPLGLNVGIVEHVPGDYIKSTYQKADEIMRENKRSMYTDFGLERRR